MREQLAGLFWTAQVFAAYGALQVEPLRVVSAFDEGRTTPSSYVVLTCPGHPEGVNFSAGGNAAWMTVAPTNGFCPTTGTQIGVDYDVFELPAGTHTGLITIASSGVEGPPVEVEIVLEIAPRAAILRREPSSIDLSMAQGSVDTLTCAFEVWNQGSLGGELRYSATPREGGFGVSPTSGISRGERVLHTISLTNLAAMPMGSYMAIVDVADLDSHDREDVYVNLRVLGEPGRVEFAPASFSVATEQGRNPPSPMLTVTNLGEEEISYRLTASTPWLPAAIAQGGLFGAGTRSIPIPIDCADMAPGTYHASILLRTGAAEDSPRLIPIDLEITPANLVPACSAIELEETLLAGNVSTQRLEVWNAGTGTMHYAFSGGIPWLSISSTGGVSHAGEAQVHDVVFTAGGFSNGTRRGVVLLNAPGANPESIAIEVALHVEADLRFQPASIHAASDFAGTVSAATATVWNAGGPTLYPFVVSNVPPWLSVLPMDGSIGPAPTALRFDFDVDTLEPGTHRAFVQVVAGPATLEIPVRLDVATRSASFEERIVFSRGHAEVSRVWSIRPDGTGLRPLLDDEFPVHSAVPSPNGRNLMFARREGFSQRYLFRDLLTGDERDRPLALYPRWTSDGAAIVGRRVDEYDAIHLHRLNGDTARIFREPDGSAISLMGVNRLTSRIYYSIGGGGDEGTRLRALFLTNGVWRNLLFAENRAAFLQPNLISPDAFRLDGQLSPGDRHLAYSKSGRFGSSPARIHLFELERRREISLNDSDSLLFQDSAPIFSPGGDRIVFLRRWGGDSNALVVVDLATRSESVLLADTDPLNPSAWNGLFLPYSDDTVLSVSPASATISVESMAAESPTATLTVRNAGSDWMAFDLEHLSDWTWSSVSGGTSEGENVVVDVGVYPDRLPEGVHTGQVVVVANAANSPVAFQLVANVGPAAPRVGVESTNLLCAVPLGGSASRRLWIWNAGGRRLEYGVAVDEPWMSVSPSSGSSTGELGFVELSFNAAGFPLGTQTGHVVVVSATSTQTVQAVMDVRAAVGIPPVLALSTTELAYATTERRPPPAQGIEIWNDGGELLEYTLSPNVDWIEILPPATPDIPGQSRGERIAHAIRCNVADLPASSRSASIRVASNGGTQAVDVAFSIGPAPLHSVKIESLVGDGRVDFSPLQDKYADMTTVRLTAIPDPMNQFVAWSGDLSGSATQRVLLVDGPKNLGASFKTVTHVYGKVTNRVTGNPIAGVAVSQGKFSTTTDAGGNYAVRSTAGIAPLSFSKAGFLPVHARVNAAAASGTPRNAGLEPNFVRNLSAAQRPGTNLVDISYSLQGETATCAVSLEASSDDGRTWTVPICTRTGDAGLAVRSGDDKRIVWNAGACSAGRHWPRTRVALVVDGKRYPSPSFPLDLRAPRNWRARVWSDRNGNGRFDHGEHVPNALVSYGSRQAASTTDANGFLAIPSPAAWGAPLFARKMIHSEPSAKTVGRAPLDNAIFYLWLDSDLGGGDDWDGTWRSLTLNSADLDRLSLGREVLVRLAHPVFEWHLLFGVQSASADLVGELRECIPQASELLYHVTDGQMKIGAAAISNNLSTNASIWIRSDVQIYDDTSVWPQATVEGYLLPNRGNVALPREWPVNGLVHHPSDDEYVRTLVHELGHYLFSFYDEYENGERTDSGPFRRHRDRDRYRNYPVDYGLMDRASPNPIRMSSYRDYLASYPTNVAASNVTAQAWFRKLKDKNGELFPAWQWLKRNFDRTYSGYPVQLIAPPYGIFENGASTVADRQGPTHVPRPYLRPRIYAPPAPSASSRNLAESDADDNFSRSLLVLLDGQPASGARVSLAPADASPPRRVGAARADGKLDRIPARTGDVLSAHHRGLKASRRVDAADPDPLVLRLESPAPAPAGGPTPLAVWPSDTNAMGIVAFGAPSDAGDWSMRVRSAKPWSTPPRVRVMPAFESTADYSLLEAGGSTFATGLVHLGSSRSGLVEIDIDLQEGGTFHTLDSYTLLQAQQGVLEDYHSIDGRVRLLPVDEPPAFDSAILVYQMQGPVLRTHGLSGDFQIGPVVSIQTSRNDAFPPDGRRSALEFTFNGEDLSGIDASTLALYRWTGSSWTLAPSHVSHDRGTVSASSSFAGTFVLMASAAQPKPPPSAIEDLSALTGAVHGHVDLTWTAPGNDSTNGAAFAYVLAHADDEILDETAWNAAAPFILPFAPAPFGEPEQYSIPLANPGSVRFFALRARDQNGQLGPLSNSPGARSRIDDVDGSGVSAQWFAAVNADRDIPMELDEDADGDGLTTREEYFLGSDPNNWDTSGDGLPDGWKFRMGLDPLSADDADEDSDGDGLANRQEYELGTDPRNPDSSGDGIPDGWKFRMGLDPLTSANEDGADADPDADDATNWEEYVADTDPLDDASRLQIDSIQSADGAFFLHLDASPARRFAVTSTTNLLAPWHVLAPAQPGQGPGTEFEIPAPSPAGYLIIRAEVP